MPGLLRRPVGVLADRHLVGAAHTLRRVSRLPIDLVDLPAQPDGHDHAGICQLAVWPHRWCMARRAASDSRLSDVVAAGGLLVVAPCCWRPLVVALFRWPLAGFAGVLA